ncbi:MAG: site-specific integrase, partial [Oscillospiraceae bacterium]|nr:site-specific integrase [Oscillospiraceae bacterium]
MGNIQKTTYSGYEIASLKHILPFFERRGTLLADMTREDLQAFVGYLFDKGLKPKSIQGYMKPLQASCRRAYTDGLMARNPTSGVKLPAVQSGTAPSGADVAAPEGTAPSHTLEEVRQLLDYTASINWECHALIFTAYYTGMRGEELLALRWSDVLWEHRAIKVHRVRVRTASDEVYEREGTKTSDGRLVPMGSKLMEVLTAERERQLANAALLGMEAGDYVFSQNDGTPWQP